jgi:hypothetical protein
MRIASFILAAALTSTPTLAADQQPMETATKPAAAEASIPFTQFGTIRDWRPDGDRGLYIRGSGNQWYYATLMSKCNGINFTDTIGFDNEPNGTLDKFSSIRVDGQTCQFTSLVKSDPPTIERKSRKRDM